MPGRIERLPHVLERINRLITPLPLLRSKHWLLTHYPLAWRVGLLSVLWWSALGCAAAVLIAIVRVRLPVDVPRSSDLNVAHAWAAWCSVFACAIWAKMQLRDGTGEISLRRHLRLLLLNMTAIVMLFLPGRAYMLATTYLAADTIPDAVLRSELDLHREHNFWRCSSKITTEAVTRNRARIEQALARFGISTMGQTSPCSQEEGKRNLDVQAPPGVFLHDLEGKLTSVAASKDLWRHFSGAYRDSLVAQARVGMVLALLFALLQGLKSHPAYAWRRALCGLRFWKSHSHTTRRQARSYRRFESKLIREYPLFWAARMHWIPIAVAITFAGSSVLLALIYFVGAMGWDRFLMFDFGTAAFVWPFIWLLLRRNDVAAVPTTPHWKQVSSYLLSTFPVTALLLTLALVTGPADVHELRTLAGLLLWALCIACFVACIAVARICEGCVQIFVFVTVGLLIWYWAPWLLLSWPVVALARRRHRVSTWRRVAAAILILALAGVPIVAFWRLQDYRTPDETIFNAVAKILQGPFLIALVALGGVLLLATLLFFLWVLPLAKILTCWGYQPKAN